MITDHITNTSEVARLRVRIALEYEAARRAMDDPAITARHEIIAHRYQQVGVLTGQLSNLIGSREAHEDMISPISLYHHCMEES